MANMAQVSPVTDDGLVTAGTGPAAASSLPVLGAGARWSDVYSSFHASGKEWVVTGGLCPTVGVAGFTMGGGTGPAVRQYGMGIDSVNRCCAD